MLKLGFNQAHVADRAFAGQFEPVSRAGMAAPHERFHEEHLVGPAGFKHHRHFVMVQGEGFFAEDMLVGFRRLHGQLAMPVVHQRDINRVDFLISQHRGIRGVAFVFRQIVFFTPLIR
jgi:hypothetical protein